MPATGPSTGRLEGPLGYGGTRYLPLFFALHAALIRAGINPVTAGYALSAVSVALLVAAVFILLRRLQVEPIVAATAAAVALACQPVQMALLAIRGDALPAALALLGLAAATNASRLVAAAILFTLAFATKSTSLYAAVAAVGYLALSGRRREALRLSMLVAAGVAATLVAMELVERRPRALDDCRERRRWIRPRKVFSAPMSFARILRRVPESTFFIQLAAAVLLVRMLRPASIAEAGWLFSLGATLVIYASPATVENHLVDLTALSVVVIAAIDRRRATGGRGGASGTRRAGRPHRGRRGRWSVGALAVRDAGCDGSEIIASGRSHGDRTDRFADLRG